MTRHVDPDRLAALLHLAECEVCQVGLMAAVLVGEAEGHLADVAPEETGTEEVEFSWTCGTCGHALHALVAEEEGLRVMGYALMSHTWDHLQETRP